MLNNFNSEKFKANFHIPLWDRLFEPSLYAENAPIVNTVAGNNRGRITTNPNDLPKIIPTASVRTSRRTLPDNHPHSYQARTTALEEEQYANNPQAFLPPPVPQSQQTAASNARRSAGNNGQGSTPSLPPHVATSANAIVDSMLVVNAQIDVEKFIVPAVELSDSTISNKNNGSRKRVLHDVAPILLAAQRTLPETVATTAVSNGLSTTNRSITTTQVATVPAVQPTIVTGTAFFVSRRIY